MDAVLRRHNRRIVAGQWRNLCSLWAPWLRDICGGFPSVSASRSSSVGVKTLVEGNPQVVTPRKGYADPSPVSRTAVLAPLMQKVARRCNSTGILDRYDTALGPFSLSLYRGVIRHSASSASAGYGHLALTREVTFTQNMDSFSRAPEGWVGEAVGQLSPLDGLG